MVPPLLSPTPCWSRPSHSGPSLLPPLSSGHAPLPLADTDAWSLGPGVCCQWLFSTCSQPACAQREGGRLPLPQMWVPKMNH